MRAQKSFLIAFVCLVLGFIATISLAQSAPDDLSVEELGAGAKLVITSVSGPVTATHNQTISVTYRVKNQGNAASGSYKVGLYLSADNKIDPATDRLLRYVTFAAGLAPGKSRQETTKVLVPSKGLAGNYYYGAVVAGRKKASLMQVSIPRYALADDNDTVKDHKTGLIWQVADDGGYRKWADASQYCSDLVLGGKADWRIPRIDELETIVDYSRHDPAIDPVFSAQSSGYWSGSTTANHPDNAWTVYFNYGYRYSSPKTLNYSVRCVRGGPFWPFDPSTHLQTPSGKPGTVLDTYWGYMWEKEDTGALLTTLDQANAYCDGLELDGYSDWRIPEIQALLTIVDYTHFDPALSAIFDPRGREYYWSGTTTNALFPGGRWILSFYDGFAAIGGNDCFVRCVRGGSVPTYTVPKAPIGVAATAGSAQATVSFAPPKSDGGSPITSYTVTSNPGGMTETGTASPITVTGLTNGTAYTFTVTATNAVGTGPASSPSKSVMPIGPATVPGVPAGVWATAGNTQAMVIFMVPTSDGGSPITLYTVTSSPGGNTKTGASSPITVTGLTNGTAYTFTVTATNAVGTGLASSPSNSVMPIETRYVNDGDGTVADIRTGLVWQKADDGTQRKWADAGQYCENLILGGHDDWRIPRIDELETIVDYSRSDPAIDPVFGVSYHSGYYWSGSTFASWPDGVWAVGFGSGWVIGNGKSSGQIYVRCVRGGPFWPFDPSTHLQTPGGKPGTVLDTYWGYMWEKEDTGTLLTMDQANAYCDGLELDGYSDWRIPEIQALLTIVDYTHFDPALSTIFDPLRSYKYWSSNSCVGDRDYAWDVNFKSGQPDTSYRTAKYYVRCVRGGP